MGILKIFDTGRSSAKCQIFQALTDEGLKTLFVAKGYDPKKGPLAITPMGGALYGSQLGDEVSMDFVH